MPTSIHNLVTDGISRVTMKWREQYVTAGVNRKMSVVTPPGIYRGWRLGPTPPLAPTLSRRIYIYGDATTGDHAAAIKTNTGYTLTVWTSGEYIALNIDGVEFAALQGQTVVVAIRIAYTNTGAATTAEIVGFVASEWDGLSSTAKREFVVLGTVVVPGPSIEIPPENITHERRTEAWDSVAPGAVAWAPMLQNGGFEYGPALQPLGTYRNYASPWENTTVTNGTWELDDTDSASGGQNLMLVRTSPGGMTGNISQDIHAPFNQATHFRLRLKVKGLQAVTAGDLSISVDFLPSSEGSGNVYFAVPLPATVPEIDTTYRLIDQILPVPVGSTSLARVRIMVNSLTVASGAVAAFRLDDMEVFLETGGVFAPHPEYGRKGTAVASALAFIDPDMSGTSNAVRVDFNPLEGTAGVLTVHRQDLATGSAQPNLVVTGTITGTAGNVPGYGGVHGYGSASDESGVVGEGVGSGNGVTGQGGPTNGIGVWGEGGGSDGDGVTGRGGGTGSGVYGMGGATNGIGVIGTASGTGWGIFGTGGSGGGQGVRGQGGGVAQGVYGLGGASGGIGVEGKGSGTATGVFGTAGNSGGIGVTGQGILSGSGVEGTGGTSGTGVKGTGQGNGYGVAGYGATPVSASAPVGSGVVGLASSLSAAGAGGYFRGAGTGAGIYGSGSPTGSIGAYGISTGSYAGVYGLAGASGGYGVFGSGKEPSTAMTASAGTGLIGIGTYAGGVGVWAVADISHGGYFKGGSSGVGIMVEAGYAGGPGVYATGGMGGGGYGVLGKCAGDNTGVGVVGMGNGATLPTAPAGTGVIGAAIGNGYGGSFRGNGTGHAGYFTAPGSGAAGVLADGGFVGVQGLGTGAAASGVIGYSGEGGIGVKGSAGGSYTNGHGGAFTSKGTGFGLGGFGVGKDFSTASPPAGTGVLGLASGNGYGGFFLADPSGTGAGVIGWALGTSQVGIAGTGGEGGYGLFGNINPSATNGNGGSFSGKGTGAAIEVPYVAYSTSSGGVHMPSGGLYPGVGNPYTNRLIHSNIVKAWCRIRSNGTGVVIMSGFNCTITYTVPTLALTLNFAGGFIGTHDYSVVVSADSTVTGTSYSPSVDHISATSCSIGAGGLTFGTNSFYINVIVMGHQS